MEEPARELPLCPGAIVALIAAEGAERRRFSVVWSHVRAEQAIPNREQGAQVLADVTRVRGVVENVGRRGREKVEARAVEKASVYGERVKRDQ